MVTDMLLLSWSAAREGKLPTSGGRSSKLDAVQAVELVAHLEAVTHLPTSEILAHVAARLLPKD